jgi:urease accessory protein
MMFAKHIHRTPTTLAALLLPRVLWALVLWSLFLWSGAAWAHVEPGQAGGFVSGLSHPVSGLDHVVAMIAVGLWGAQLGRPAVWILPVAFPMIMAFGGMLGLIGAPLPGVEVGIALSAVVLGALVLGRVRLPLAAAVIVVACFAVFHGHAHGTELQAGQNAMLYSIGFVIATGLLHAVGITIGLVQRWDLGSRALRGAGGLVMAAGLYFLWGAVA